MQDVRDDEREPSARQTEPAQLVVGQRLPREAPRRRVEAHRFVNHHARIRQVREIGVLGRTSVEHGVDLLLESPSRRCMLRQQIPRPRQRQRRRLLTRQQERRDLDPQLLVGHGLAGLLVARRQQHGQQVARCRTGCAGAG